MDITGKLHKVFAAVQVSEKFTKREFVIELSDNSQYPQYISLQLTQDKVSLVDNFDEGAELTVSINLRGRAWTNPKDGETKYFNTLEAWRIQSANGSSAPSNSRPQPKTETETTRPVVTDASKTEEVDDLPF